MLLEKILTTTEYVTRNSRKVKINETAIAKVAQKIKDHRVPKWDNFVHFRGTTEQTIQYLFILDSINFCFWAEKGHKRWAIKQGQKTINGYFALALALKRTARKYPLLDAGFLAAMNKKTCQEIFSSCNQQAIPLFEMRYKILRQTGQILLKKYQGQAVNIVKKAEHSAQRLAGMILKDFSSFRDIATFQNKKIYLLKRAQIFVGDVWGALKSKGLGHFDDIEKLTCFADYKIPQILHHFGVLEYSPALLKKIKNETLLAADSSAEVEIRANTIWAIEKIKEALLEQSREIPSFQIDWILWNMAQKIKMPIPYHKTKTIYY